ncbi:Uncharacterised protein [Mycobacterium tuberculosis]|nr:Uncharacterised protein [Mycobacterium tuberculosis]
MDRPKVIASTSGGTMLSIEPSLSKLSTPSLSNQPHWNTTTRLP